MTLPIRVDGTTYEFNLIDTPGHVDFSYEVSRSLAACEGAILVVDASQGIQAQTVANVHLATEGKLAIVPFVNKIDLPHAHPLDVMGEMEKAFAFDVEEMMLGSAKTGEGVDALFAAVVRRVPPPPGDETPLRALVFDSEYNEFRGVVTYIRLFSGRLRRGDRIRMLGARENYEALEVGKFMPDMKPVAELLPGEVGYVIAGIKRIQDVQIGDTVTHEEGHETVELLPGYKEPKQFVFCSLYPAASEDYEALRKALDRLSLNDSSFSFLPESSPALGFGFRCGFLGLLHMEIVQERLERESDLDLVQTAPTVTYEILLVSEEVVRITSPAELPEPFKIREFREPYVRLSMIVPADSIGNIMKLAESRRGTYQSTEYLSETRVILVYEVPLAEILYDFFDKLKSLTSGYGTMDYEWLGFRPNDLVKLRILIGGDEVDALSSIVHRDKAFRKAKALLSSLKSEIPRHMFQIALQAAIGGRVIARENIVSMAKNVLAKCYGGDISRKRKLLEKQKEGKRRMKSIGRVTIPQKAFLAVLASAD
ncbi:MAG: elongation factor 4 [Planctomycetes bacterium]|nr:elongation factor 4 [Planctomycetota bacterium]